MCKRTTFIFLFLLSLINFSFKESNENQQDVFENMFKKIVQIKTLKYELTNKERIGNKYLEGTQYIEWQANPYACYIKTIAPSKDDQLIYNASTDGFYARYKAASFPYLSLKLNPFGNTIRKNNHHTIFDLGYLYLSNTLKNFMNLPDVKLENLETININNKSYQKVSLVNNSYKLINFQVAKESKIDEIAKEKHISSYKIYELNKGLDYEKAIPKNYNITIPNAYAKKIEVIIDKTLNLPYILRIYDEKGLFEEFKFEKVDINPKFDENNFDEKRIK